MFTTETKTLPEHSRPKLPSYTLHEELVRKIQHTDTNTIVTNAWETLSLGLDESLVDYSPTLLSIWL
jgi:hypothetical protein